MIYTLLFVCLPVFGLLMYVAIVRRMMVLRLPSAPSVPMFFVFAAYGAVLLFIISDLTRVWSGMHSVAIGGLIVVGLPWLIVQGFLWRKTWRLSGYHRATIILSFTFPVALASLFILVPSR